MCRVFFLLCFIVDIVYALDIMLAEVLKIALVYFGVVIKDLADNRRGH